MKKFKYYPVIAFAICVLLVGCERDFITPEKNTLTKPVLYDLMKRYYYWYDQMPEVNPDDYSSLTALLDDLLYKPNDKWSYVISTEEYESYYGRGEYIGHGFGLKWDLSGKLRVTFTYDGTTARDQGIERGWELLSVNGETITPESYLDSLLGADSIGVQNTFSFKNNMGQSTSLTLSKEVIEIKAVLHSEIIELDSLSVGYMVYQQFLATSKTELNDVFSSFVEGDIDEVVVDLRYNSGGQVDIAQHLGSLLAGEFAVKRTFVKFQYNDKNSDRNVSYPFQEPANMLVPTPGRVFFITTGSSASASELVINSLLGLTGLNRPLDIYLVGDDTYGKPVGSIARPYSDSTLVPITFKYTNRLDEGDFFEGLKADSYIDEDFSKQFGDPEEPLLKEVLYFIDNNSFTGSGRKKAVTVPELELEGIHSETGAI